MATKTKTKTKTKTTPTMTEQEKITALRAMIDRFLQEGEYNDEGDYVFVSDTPESGPLAEPDSMVPKVVLDACALLRRIEEPDPAKITVHE